MRAFSFSIDVGGGHLSFYFRGLLGWLERYTSGGEFGVTSTSFTTPNDACVAKSRPTLNDITNSTALQQQVQAMRFAAAAVSPVVVSVPLQQTQD